MGGISESAAARGDWRCRWPLRNVDSSLDTNLNGANQGVAERCRLSEQPPRQPTLRKLQQLRAAERVQADLRLDQSAGLVPIVCTGFRLSTGRGLVRHSARRATAP